MAIKYTALSKEISNRGIVKKRIAERLGIDPRSLNKKINGDTAFTWQEANTIRDVFFPDLDLQTLMKADEEPLMKVNPHDD